MGFSLERPRGALSRMSGHVWSSVERSQFDDPASFCRCLCRCPWRLQRLGGQNSDRPVLRTNEDSPSGHRPDVAPARCRSLLSSSSCHGPPRASRRPRKDLPPLRRPRPERLPPLGLPKRTLRHRPLSNWPGSPRAIRSRFPAPPGGAFPLAAKRPLPVLRPLPQARPRGRPPPHPTPRPPPGHRKLLSGSFRRSLPEATTLLAKGRPSTRRRP